MAERIVSPGVFTRENDLSFLSQGIGEIGAAFIGPFKQGPAFVPTIVRTQSEFEDIFGTPDGTYYTEYAVQNYLREAGQATIVRVAGITGYSQIGPLGIFASGSGADDRLIGVLYSSNTGDEAVQISGSIASNPSSVGRFQINISGSGGNNIITPISASIVPDATGKPSPIAVGRRMVRSCRFGRPSFCGPCAASSAFCCVVLSACFAFRDARFCCINPFARSSRSPTKLTTMLVSGISHLY